MLWYDSYSLFCNIESNWSALQINLLIIETHTVFALGGNEVHGQNIFF